MFSKNPFCFESRFIALSSESGLSVAVDYCNFVSRTSLLIRFDSRQPCTTHSTPSTILNDLDDDVTINAKQQLHYFIGTLVWVCSLYSNTTYNNDLYSWGRFSGATIEKDTKHFYQTNPVIRYAKSFILLLYGRLHQNILLIEELTRVIIARLDVISVITLVCIKQI